jgi:biotin synthase-like enzyme
MTVKKCFGIIERGGNIDFDLALELATKVDTTELVNAADKLRHHIHGDRFDLCSIINAKSGKCSEDCRFCAQSAHYATDISTYDVISIEEALIQAKDSDDHSVERISLVTAGKSASLDDMHKYGEIYQEMRRKTGLRFCASMGMLTREKAELLRSYGVERYHCNLETCRRFFPEVCSQLAGKS